MFSPTWWTGPGCMHRGWKAGITGVCVYLAQEQEELSGPSMPLLLGCC